MITKEFNLEGKLVIPIIMKSQTGRSNITGTFYVYEDEKLAKKHINPVIFARLEKAKKKAEEAAQNEVKEESADDSSKKEETAETTTDNKEKVDETKAKEPQADEEKK